MGAEPADAGRLGMVHDDVIGDQIIVLLGTLAGAVVAYLLQSLTIARQQRYTVTDRTRTERLDAAAAPPTALLEYRHAQIARQLERVATGRGHGPLDNEVREARAGAWSALYRLELLVDDQAIRDAAYHLMTQIKSLKTIDDPSSLDGAGTKVHWGIQEFVKLARTRLVFA